MSGESKQTLGSLESVFGPAPNPVFSNKSDIEQYQEAQQNFLDALQMRYAQPNWWKVAAGFAKPQLGGFMASLGSAAEALGENVEQQRSALLPMAQLRAQMASYNASLGQKKKAGELFASALGIDPEDAESVMAGNKPLPPGAHRMMPAETAGVLNILDPNGTGAAATKMVEMAQREAELTQKANASAIENAAYFAKYGKNIPGFVPTGSGAYQQQGNNVQGIPLYDNKGNPLDSSMNLPAAVQPAAAPNAPAMPSVEEKAPSIPKMQVNVIGEMPQSSGREGVLANEYVKFHQALYDAISSGADDATKNNLMANINGLKREMTRSKITPPELGMPILETSTQTPATAPSQETVRPTPVISQAISSPQNAQISQSPITFEGQGNPVDTAIRLSEESQKKTNAMYEPRINEIITRGDPQVVSDNDIRNQRLLELGGTPGVVKGTGLLYKDKGYLNAIQNALEEGLHGNVSTPGGGFGLSISAPIVKTINAMNLEPEEKKQLREFALLNAQRTGDALSAAIRASSGGGHANIAEFQTGLSRITNANDPHKILMSDITKDAIENQRLGKSFELLGDYQNNPSYANRPLSSFLHSKEYKKLIDDYAPKLRDARKLAD
jgi:hypothetical protein